MTVRAHIVLITVSLPETCYVCFDPPSHPQHRHSCKKKNDVTCPVWAFVCVDCVSVGKTIWLKKKGFKICVTVPGAA